MHKYSKLFVFPLFTASRVFPFLLKPQQHDCTNTEMCQPTIANAQTAFSIILQWVTQLGLRTVAFHVGLSPHTNAAVEVESQS